MTHLKLGVMKCGMFRAFSLRCFSVVRASIFGGLLRGFGTEGAGDTVEREDNGQVATRTLPLDPLEGIFEGGPPSASCESSSSSDP